MKTSGLPEMSTAARTVPSSPMRSSSAPNSALTALLSVFTDWPGTSKVTTATAFSLRIVNAVICSPFEDHGVSHPALHADRHHLELHVVGLRLVVERGDDARACRV